MKKILSLVLVAFMLVSVFPTGILAARGTGYGWQWDDSVSYGYIKNYGSSSGSDMIVEMDAAIVRGGEGAKFEFWTTTSAISYNAITGTATIGSATGNFSWGNLIGSNWHHLRYIFNNGKATLEIDGTTVVSADGITAHNNEVLFFSNWGILTIDNFKISNNAGSTIMSCDFEDAAQATNYFGEGLGTRIEVSVETPDPTPTTELGWVARVDAYSVMGKDIEKVNYPVANAGSIEFDLAMVPGSSGTSKLEIFDGYEGCIRLNILPNAVGVFYTPTESESLTGFTWGDLNLTNWRHVKYEHSSDDVKLYIDGEHVYTVSHGCTPALPGCSIYMSEGSAFVDNLVFTDSTGTVHGSFDFEGSIPDSDGMERVYIGNCDVAGHIPSNRPIRTADPTCTEDGSDVTYCLSCGNEAIKTVVPKLGHAFGVYTDGKVTTAPTATVDGNITWTCSRCHAATASGTAVATGDYKGTITAFDDMQDENVTKDILKGFCKEASTNNGISYPGETFETEGDVSYLHSYTDANYHQFVDIDTSGFTVSFDFRPQGMFDNSDTDNYGHNLHFWIGGGSGIGNWIGYDFETQQFFAKPDDGKAYDAVTADYTLEEGMWYNITFKYYSDASGDAWAALYCDGTEVLKFANDDAIFELPFPANIKTFPLIIRTFGIQYDVTNFVIGDTNFEWVNFRTPVNEDPVFPGDISGDGRINARDLLALRQYIAGNLPAAFVEENADVDQNGRINTKDVKALKIMLAGI